MSTVLARAIGSAPLSLRMDGVAIPLFMREAGPLPCTEEQPDLFFPDDYSLRCKRQIDQARNHCLGCPVRAQCLEWAVPQTRLEGIWAATTPPERRRIRVKKKAA